MDISRDVGINPGFGPVVHVTEMELAALTGQLKPSIVML